MGITYLKPTCWLAQEIMLSSTLAAIGHKYQVTANIFLLRFLTKLTQDH